MGWTYSYNRFDSIKAFAQSLVDELKGHQDKNKSEGHAHWDILAHQVISNTLLIYSEKINSKGLKEKDIFVYLLDKSDGEYGYKDMDAFCGPSKIVTLSKKWHDWFLNDNALLCDDKQSEWAKNWVENCYQKTLNGKAKSSHKKQLMELLNAQKSVPVRLRILDNRQVTLVGTLSRGRTAEIIDKDGRYKSCKWNYLELAE